MTSEMRAVAVVAEALADCAPRRWWRRPPSPMDFVPAARVVVMDLKSKGVDFSALADLRYGSRRSR